MTIQLQHFRGGTLELRDISLEKLSANPSGGGLYEGRLWVNTTANTLNLYKNSVIETIPNINDTAASLISTYSSTKIDALFAASAAGADWQNNVLALQVDATLDPGATPTLGDRYALNDVGSLNANFGVIAGVGNGDIVEYNGSAFVVKYDASANPNGGAFVYIDALAALYYLNSTPLWVSFINSASTTVSGIVELATQSESEATTDTVRAATPASLSRFVQTEVVANQSFTVDVAKVISHRFGATGVIKSVTIFPTGTNSDGSDVVFTNNADGTISITLNSVAGNPFDVHINGTNA